MRNFQKGGKIKSFIRSKPFLILLTIVIVLFAWNIFGLLGKMQDTYKNKKNEQEKISSLQKRKEKLTSDILKLNTDKGKEEVIRDNFGMVKEGEQVIVIVDEKKLNTEETAPKNSGIIDFFKNLFSK